MRVSAPHFEPKELRVTLGAERQVRVALAPAAMGLLEFRFFPARAKVWIGDRALQTSGSNLVREALVAGMHTLRIQDPATGRERRVRVRIRAGATTALGTIEASKGNPKRSEDSHGNDPSDL